MDVVAAMEYLTHCVGVSRLPRMSLCSCALSGTVWFHLCNATPRLLLQSVGRSLLNKLLPFHTCPPCSVSLQHPGVSWEADTYWVIDQHCLQNHALICV